MNPHPHDVYLNNAATSWPKPGPVIDAVKAHFAGLPGESGRSTDELTRDPIHEARKNAAGFFGCPDSDHLIFTSGATESLNLLIHGFIRRESEPCHVITTDLDHNSVLRPLTTLADHHIVDITVLSSRDGYITAGDIEEALRDDTRLVVINHGSNVLGTVQPVREIQAVLPEEIFLLADGSQTAGQVQIDIPSLGVDAYVFTGHKYLFGLSGTGGFWIRDPDRVEPVKQGGTGTNSKNLRQPRDMPERFEAGTPNYPGIISLSAGISYIRSVGIDRIQSHAAVCSRAFYHAINNADQVICYSPQPDIPVFPVNIMGMDADMAGFILHSSHGIITRTGLHCAPLIHNRITNGTGCIRLSPSYLTNPEDCQYAGETIASLAEKVQGSK